MKYAAGLSEFIDKSPTAFHAVQTECEMLEAAGFKRLYESERWDIVPGGRYYVKRNDSSVVAVAIGSAVGAGTFTGNDSDAGDDIGAEEYAAGAGAADDLAKLDGCESAVAGYGIKITASHSDSPMFKIKENSEIEAKGGYVKLNTEGYGGMICYSWMDRPLSIAGRVILRAADSLKVQLVNLDRDMALIPSLAIHMNRDANSGKEFNKQTDMLPLVAMNGDGEFNLKALIAEELGVNAEDICGMDLYLYNHMKSSIWGAKGEFLSAPRIDDLQCAYASLKGYLEAVKPVFCQDGNQATGVECDINVYACFDNEEVGSGSKQGADSTMLHDVLWRINEGLGYDAEALTTAVANGFMLSCDNAHAVHPNYPDKYDQNNYNVINGGVVVKHHAGQKYTSDGLSTAIFRNICEKADVPVQTYANRSDMVGGSTLGNIAMAHVSVNAVDVGLPQLAMHSSYETAGVKDTTYMVSAVKCFYESCFRAERGGILVK